MTTGRTARLGLELLEPGQAQKELFHNEALAALDLGVQASVVGVGVDMPPETPSAGQCWIVGAAPTGAWSGRAGAIAGWTEGGWRFLAAREGVAAWDEARRITMRFSGGTWEDGVVRAGEVRVGGQRVVGDRAAAIAAPAGGGTIDAEARAAVTAVVEALRRHGLIAG